VRWLVLTGYMGAGKTSVGRRVATRLERPFIDADAAIEEHAGMAIAEIFPKKGEVWFRRTEEAVIRDLLRGEPGVLALGGGALQSAKTRALVHRDADVVWLRVAPEVAWRRVSGSDRPLAVDHDRFVRRAHTREPGYRDAAHFEVDADQPIEDTVARVLNWAQRRGGPEEPEETADG
jgi:shikimate kinase